MSSTNVDGSGTGDPLSPAIAPEEPSDGPLPPTELVESMPGSAKEPPEVEEPSRTRATTESLVMRSRSGTVRRISARHDRTKMRELLGAGVT